MSSVKTTLLQVRELIATPGQWTKGVFSNVNSRGVRCYCLSGALMTVAGWGTEEEGVARRLLRSRIDDGQICDWNDAPERTHADVIKLLDEVIREVA